MPPKKKRGATKTLVLHHGATKVEVEVFAQTTRADLFAGIRESLGLPAEAPLRFRDANGSIVLLAASFVHGTVLHVAVEQGAPVAVVQAAPTDPAVRWDVCSTSGRIEGAVFSVPDDRIEWFGFSTVLPTRAPSFYALNFAMNMCCISIGVVPVSLVSPQAPTVGCVKDMWTLGTARDRVTPARILVGYYPDKGHLIMRDADKPREELSHAFICEELRTPHKLTVFAPKHGVRCELHCLTAADAEALLLPHNV